MGALSEGSPQNSPWPQHPWRALSVLGSSHDLCWLASPGPAGPPGARGLVGEITFSTRLRGGCNPLLHMEQSISARECQRTSTFGEGSCWVVGTCTTLSRSRLGLPYQSCHRASGLVQIITSRLCKLCLPRCLVLCRCPHTVKMLRVPNSVLHQPRLPTSSSDGERSVVRRDRQPEVRGEVAGVVI